MTAGKSLRWALCMVILTVGLTGCGKREADTLKARVAVLEQELADTKIKLEDIQKEFDESRTKSQQEEAKEEALTNDLVKVKVERDQLRQEVAALKKRR